MAQQDGNWNEISIKSEEDAFRLIEQALENQIGDKPCKLNFENWPILTIRLEGEGYESTITSDLAEALVSLQHALDRSYARLVHDLPTSRRLTLQEREGLKFKAKVEQGSSIVKIDLGDWAEKTSLALVEKMSPELLVASVIGVAVIIASTVSYKAFLRSRSDDKKVTEEASVRVQLSKEESRRHEILAKALALPNLEYVRQDFDQAKVALLKGVGDADSLTVSGVKLEREDANVIARSKRSESAQIQANGRYKIIEVGWQQDNEVHLRIAGIENGREFAASFKDDSLDGAQITLLKEAEWSRDSVYLSINATELRGQITTAAIVGVEKPD